MKRHVRPYRGQEFYRTDLSRHYVYNGKRWQARPATPRNQWIGLLGLIAYALVTAAFLWALSALLLAMA